MLDIEGSQIAQLNDTELRTLVRRLCEAELRRAGLPVSAVTAGGDQNAPDGGLDVRVDLPPSTHVGGYIPKPTTGFQVKVPDMPRSEILDEMRPGGTIRQVIRDLAALSGAYIIISAKGSTADRSLQNRREAMREALGGLFNPDALTTDFYDRERLATWVRDHPGVIVWVRKKIGQPIPGWRPYSNWATPSESAEAEYLTDNKSRVHDWQSPQEGPLQAEEAIHRIRVVLSQPTGAVRLIGLSGTGKTRLVQALFDDRLGEQALAPALAVYTDLADQPQPSPRELARHLIQNRQRAIMVVDNCPPETHRALASICKEPESTLSLITVEYDVGDDDPEGTEVFRLEPSSDGVIESILERQAPQLSQLDRHQIAESSGGNARIALALAHTVRRGESIANLTNRELFERLFHQRQQPDQTLLRAAEVCSLVYSFNGEALEGDAAELPFLARLAGMTAFEFYRHVAELKNRKLVQCRGPWRAVLPHALANRLAHRALEKMPADATASFFLNESSERLLKSYSRRLSYLHDSNAAQQIVRKWLDVGGPLSDLPFLNQLRITVFENIAPVLPDAALDAIERAANGPNGSEFLGVSSQGRRTWVSLLRSLAYDPELFQRAALLLARFVLCEPSGYQNNSAQGPFKGLFQLYLSGTHASQHQRLEVIETLLRSNEEHSQSCGLDALDAMFEASHFSSSQSFEFGARPRDYGWHPTSRAEIATWYRVVIQYALRQTLSIGPLSDRIKSLLARNFRALWDGAGVMVELESLVHTVADQGFWMDGWIAVCDTIRHERRDVSPEKISRLRALEVTLRPRDLLHEARAYLLSAPWSAVGIGDGEPEEKDKAPHSWYISRANETAEGLGRQIAANKDVLDALLPELVRDTTGRHFQFGRGLAAGAEQLWDLWQSLIEALATVPESERNVQALRGFINTAAARDSDAADAMLDAAVVHPILGPVFPLLQTSVDIDVRGAERLAKAVSLGLAPAETYWYLSLGRATDPIVPGTLRHLIDEIASLQKGYKVAVDLLSMRIHSSRDSEESLDYQLILCGRELLRRYDFNRSDHDLDFELGEIVNACFKGNDAAEHTTKTCRKIRENLMDHREYVFRHTHVLASLFRTQPMITLDELLGYDARSNGSSFIRNFDLVNDNPLDSVPIEVLISWAERDPQVRFPRLASAITSIKEKDHTGELVWTPTALQILESAPDRMRVLSAYGYCLEPRVWSGPLSEELEKRRALLMPFLSDSDPRIADWARQTNERLRRWAQEERSLYRQRDQSFE
ncbi:MAG TPA: hypothetical protein PK250_18390 [Syntrophobacter fumaroxidans]|nr:hypothetical protein [Syntrophobacter fumaroxidans]